MTTTNGTRRVTQVVERWTREEDGVEMVLLNTGEVMTQVALVTERPTEPPVLSSDTDLSFDD